MKEGHTTRLKKTAIFLILAGLCACSDPKVAVYDAPKEAPAAASAVEAGPSGDHASHSHDRLGWKAPAGWKEEAGSGMRLATLTPPGGQADLSVIQLDGEAGGDLANINRWRGQLGLEPVASAAEGAQTIATPAGRAIVVDLKGKDSKALVGAILNHSGDTWFFKLTGPAAAVAEAKPGFLALLRSLKHGH